MQRADSLGDLAETMGDDFGHGVPAGVETEAPVPHGAPSLVDVTQTSVSVTWLAVPQAVHSVELQAAPLGKKTTSASAFADFAAGTAGAVSVTVAVSAATRKAVLDGLAPDTAYLVRMILSNATGSGTSAPAPAIVTMGPKDKKHDPKKSAKAQKELEARNKDAAKLAAKEAEKQAKEAAKLAKEREKAEKEAAKKAAKSGGSSSSAAAAAKTSGASSPRSGGAASPVAPTIATPAPVKINEERLAEHVSAGVAKRLTTGITVAKPAAAAEEKVKLFEAPKAQQHSKIHQALNPQKLYYESRREREEQEDDKVVITMRGGGLGASVRGVGADFSYARDDDGNFINDDPAGFDDGLDDEPDNYDPNNLPDFGELQEVINQRRKEREAEAEKRRAALRAEWEKKKAAERAAVEAEIARIREHDAKIKAAQEPKGDVVAEARHRLSEVHFDFTFGGAKKDEYGF